MDIRFSLSLFAGLDHLLSPKMIGEWVAVVRCTPPANEYLPEMVPGNKGDYTMTTFLKNFVTDESGASAAEYALILAIVGAGIAIAAATLGTAISGAMSSAASTINNG